MTEASRSKPTWGWYSRTLVLGVLVLTGASCAAGRKSVPVPVPGPGPNAASAAAPLITPALVPLPVSANFPATPGLPITPATSVFIQSDDPRAIFVAEFLAGLLTTVGPVGPSVVTQTPSAIPEGSIVLAIDERLSPSREAYRLEVTPLGARLTATSPAGLFHGVQTLRQILPPFLEHDAARPRPIVIPATTISDQPRFAWRGAMLDVARHFFNVSEVKRYIDLLALHKMNRLHLHLSDDQGWRIQIKSWPNLTALGSSGEVGGTVGGFYTQDDYQEIVAYAQDRFVDVVPEIDMPGHTNAALASYAELNCDGKAPPPYSDIKVGFSSLCVDNERTYAFIEDVVREIAALTPGEYLHIGGDEVKTLTEAQYAKFIVRTGEIVRRAGKQMVGWDEIAAVDLQPAPVVQHWRPGAVLKGAASRGSRFIMSPANRAYLDMQYDTTTVLGLYWAGRIEVRDSYSWDPAKELAGVGESAILGVEAPLWTETLSNMREVESMAFPRLAAIAEIGWSPQAQRNWEDFRLRLGGQGPRWLALGLNFYRSPQIPWRP